ncbi:hypothetical protein RRG08_056766 [Elysia crispata]|uniref:Uncharacterized protein n=1 Tax=Elysia crispata TaxID=231223 RepID=A0AAE1EBH1_9GAST|nr:hypothetical protein RRG08_056766 [Elysia crispata]
MTSWTRKKWFLNFRVQRSNSATKAPLLLQKMTKYCQLGSLAEYLPCLAAVLSPDHSDSTTPLFPIYPSSKMMVTGDHRAAVLSPDHPDSTTPLFPIYRSSKMMVTGDHRAAVLSRDHPDPTFRHTPPPRSQSIHLAR